MATAVSLGGEQASFEAKSSRSYALALIALKLGVSALVLASGFRALSDDDYARVVIAQRFAESPTLDPSGTSWLPLPFWIYGFAFRLLEPSLDVARALAVTLGVLGTLGVYVAARWCGTSRLVAFTVAALSTTLSYSALLGVATVPDGPTAVLLVLAAASLRQTGFRERLLGAIFVGAACLCRYEAWPVAVAFASFTAIDARRERSLRLAALVFIACSPALLWMLHGVLNHESALFFIKRVSEYRRALGGTPDPLWARFLDVPVRLLRFEPELTILTATASWFAVREGCRAEVMRYRRPAITLLALLAFLIAGELSDGAPTHHSERTLLSLWFLMCIFSSDLLFRASATLDRKTRQRVGVVLVIAISIAALLRPFIARHGAFAARESELDMGERARARGVARLAILTRDYGFFAMIAAFGRPSDTVALDELTPRKPGIFDALDDPNQFSALLNRHEVRWLAAPRPSNPLSDTHLTTRDTNEKFVLVELTN